MRLFLSALILVLAFFQPVMAQSDGTNTNWGRDFLEKEKALNKCNCGCGRTNCSCSCRFICPPVQQNIPTYRLVPYYVPTYYWDAYYGWSFYYDLKYRFELVK